MHEIDAQHPNKTIKTRLVEDAPDELGRRKWRIEHYEEEPEPEPMTLLGADPRSESFLVGRTEKLDIKSKLGRKETLDKSRKDGGFFCDVCKELYKCDIAFFTHINSAAHNRKLGMSLKVEQVGVDAVRRKLRGLAGQEEDHQLEMPIMKIMQKHKKLQAKAEEKAEKLEKKTAAVQGPPQTPPPPTPKP